MDQCAFCKADTELLESAEVPMCAKCLAEIEARRVSPVSVQEVRSVLIQDLAEATVREKAPPTGSIPL